MIELIKDGLFVKIASPYDDELKSSISDLDKSERNWDGKYWRVTESKLEWLRERARECADRRGWKIRDYTDLKTDTEIDRQKKLDAEKELGDRIYLFDRPFFCVKIKPLDIHFYVMSRGFI